MARLLTQTQKDLLRAPAVRARLLITFFLDEGTYRFCDDVMDATDGTNTYLGASALTSAVEIRSGQDMAAEPITLVLDGNRMTQFGIQDPARVLSDILDYLFQQRRVDFAYGLSYPDSVMMDMIVPVAAMKINHARLIDQRMPLEPDQPEVVPQLEIVLDSLAARYNRSTYRTRSHADQHEIDPTDDFFSFTADAANAEKNIYWGKKAPLGGGPGGTGLLMPGGSPARPGSNGGGFAQTNTNRS